MAKDDVVQGRRLGVEPICEVMQVAPSSYYAARDRPPSARGRRDAELTPRLTELWTDNYQVYGSRKLWKTARRAEVQEGKTKREALRALKRHLSRELKLYDRFPAIPLTR